jgi:hypothetical protein
MSALTWCFLGYLLIFLLALISMFEAKEEGAVILPDYLDIIFTSLIWVGSLISGFFLPGLETFGVWTVVGIVIIIITISTSSPEFIGSKWKMIFLLPGTALFFIAGLIYVL